MINRDDRNRDKPKYAFVEPYKLCFLRLLLNLFVHHIHLLMFILFFFNRRHSLLSFGGLYNSEVLPFTYGQHVAIELDDKLYSSATYFVFVLHLSLLQGCKREPKVD